MAKIKIKQHDITDCGATCLASISAHYKLQLPIAKIRQYASTDKKGTNILGLIEAAEKLGLDTSLKTVLVMGGSQGARRLNSLIVEASKAMPNIQFLQITGPGDYDRVKEELGEVENHKLLAFCDDMPAAYAVADGAICRSGASSLTELAYLGIPSVLIPYPYAADDHQTANAKVFSDVGASLMAQEKDLTGGELVGLAKQLLPLSSEREALAVAMKAQGAGDAAAQIAEVVTG